MTHVASLVIENPFHNFTSRPDVPELFNLNRPNEKALKQVHHLLKGIKKKKRRSTILPIIAEAGYGKTHFYWVIRESISDAYVIYIPVPTNPNRIYAHFYFETVRAGGVHLLEYVADYLTQKYKKVEHAALDFSGLGNVVIEGFFALKDPKRAKLALKWFTGFDVDDETKRFQRTIMDDEELALAALKIVLKIIDKPIIFFVDELESLLIALGPEAELQFLESLKKLYNEASNFLVCLACLVTLWDKILDLSSTAVQSRIEPPVVLKRFTKRDIQDFCTQMLQDFHLKFEIFPSNDIWPLEKGDIESAYAFSHGNPREAIKWLATVIEERKNPILKELKKNQKHLTQFGKQVKSVVDNLKESSGGMLQKNNGVFLSVSKPEKRILITIPPLKTMDAMFHHSYWKSLKKTIEDEGYDEVIIFGLISEEEKTIDVPMKEFSEKELSAAFLEYLEQLT